MSAVEVGEGESERVESEGESRKRGDQQREEKRLSAPPASPNDRTRGCHAPETGLGGLCLASDAARVLLARLVEPSLDTRLPVLAEVVAVEDAVRVCISRLACTLSVALSQVRGCED